VKALCPRGGVDVVFDPVGGDLFDASLRCAALHARLLVIGFAAGRIPQVPTNLVLVKNLAILGFNYGQYIGWGLTDERTTHEEDVREVLSTLTSAMARTDMPLPVTQHFPVSQWLEAIDTTMGRRSVGKVILDFDKIPFKGGTA
jgi:NADPH2:quinone reductase